MISGHVTVLSRPLLNKTSNIVSACLVMHNMCISDRVLDGNIYAVYNLGQNVDNEQQILEDLLRILINNNNNREGEDKILARIGLANSYTEFVVHHILARQKN
jgi:hypothetical protein